MISRLLSFFQDVDIATAFIRAIKELGEYFESDQMKDPKDRDELIQETINYLQSLKAKKDKK